MRSTPSDKLPLMMDSKVGDTTTKPAAVVDPHDGDVDVTLLWHMLSMSPAERLNYHDAVRKSALEMRRAGRKHYGITGYDDIDLNLLRRLTEHQIEFVVIGEITQTFMAHLAPPRFWISAHFNRP